MEIFLHLWDELDDLASASRHLAVSAAAELFESAAPAVTAASAAGVWVLDGLYRQLLRLSA